MAISTCVKCGSTRFEMKEMEPLNAARTILAVQCISCGGVAGITSYENTAALLRNLAQKLGHKL